MENGKPVPIQPLSIVHLDDYVDYSHGVRLISKRLLFDGKITSAVSILRDQQLSEILSDEGVIEDVRVVRNE
jgi:hypothetical protein